MVLASPRMTTHPLHQTAADGAAFSTFELIPTPSQPGQHHDDGKGDQPTHGFNSSRGHSEVKTAGPQLFVITEMRANAGGDGLTIVNGTGGDALQTRLNRIPGSSQLLLHGLLIQLNAL